MGIDGFCVMMQAGFCVDEGRGEFCLIIAVFCGHNSGDQLTKNSQMIAFQSSQMLLIPPMNDLGWF
jgi:hypothetical protein